MIPYFYIGLLYIITVNWCEKMTFLLILQNNLISILYLQFYTFKHTEFFYTTIYYTETSFF